MAYYMHNNKNKKPQTSTRKTRAFRSFRRKILSLLQSFFRANDNKNNVNSQKTMATRQKRNKT